tara:strand:- start:5755 stop:6225 length:471 start_codon:yes stop_codon:yes gene_type:complete
MPDWLSHLLIALIIAEVFGIKKKSLVVFGALAPDILPKIQLLFFYFELPPVVSFINFHTPFMMLLSGIIIAPLFRYDKFKTFLFFSIGAASHFLSDLTMKHFTIMGTRLLYPISTANYTLNWIWPEQSIYILIASLIIYLSIRIVKRNKFITQQQS